MRCAVCHKEGSTFTIRKGLCWSCIEKAQEIEDHLASLSREHQVFFTKCMSKMAHDNAVVSILIKE